jgi:hypothetical protein
MPAVVLAMRAIREINPAAELIQTDDLGKIHSTRHLRYQLITRTRDAGSRGTCSAGQFSRNILFGSTSSGLE